MELCRVSSHFIQRIFALIFAGNLDDAHYNPASYRCIAVLIPVNQGWGYTYNNHPYSFFILSVRGWIFGVEAFLHIIRFALKTISFDTIIRHFCDSLFSIIFTITCIIVTFLSIKLKLTITMLYKEYFNKMCTNKNRLIIKVLPILLNVIYALLLFEKNYF